MADLLSFSAKKCWTASGCMIHEGRVLLVKHKKIGVWLCPGGHLEDNEMLHEAAEREFWEETGLKVKAVSPFKLLNDKASEYIPSPILTNLHWIAKDNYEARLNAEAKVSEHTQKHWSKGCEQHLNYMFLVEPLEGMDFKQNAEETDGIAWFSPEEMNEIETFDNIRFEVKTAFKLIEAVKNVHK